MESLVADLETFRGRRVLITGHTGFKGSWLSMYLNTLGAKVIGFSLPPRKDQKLFNTSRLRSLPPTYHAVSSAATSTLQTVLERSVGCYTRPRSRLSVPP